jgi:hypothetical protein
MSKPALIASLGKANPHGNQLLMEEKSDSKRISLGFASDPDE